MQQYLILKTEQYNRPIMLEESGQSNNQTYNVLLQLVNTKIGTHNKKRGLVDKRIKTLFGQIELPNTEIGTTHGPIAQYCLLQWED